MAGASQRPLIINSLGLLRCSETVNHVSGLSCKGSVRPVTVPVTVPALISLCIESYWYSTTSPETLSCRRPQLPIIRRRRIQVAVIDRAARTAIRIVRHLQPVIERPSLRRPSAGT